MQRPPGSGSRCTLRTVVIPAMQAMRQAIRLHLLECRFDNCAVVAEQAQHIVAFGGVPADFGIWPGLPFAMQRPSRVRSARGEWQDARPASRCTVCSARSFASSAGNDPTVPLHRADIVPPKGHSSRAAPKLTSCHTAGILCGQGPTWPCESVLRTCPPIGNCPPRGRVRSQGRHCSDSPALAGSTRHRMALERNRGRDLGT